MRTGKGKWLGVTVCSSCERGRLHCKVNGEPTNGYTKNMMQLDLFFLKSIYSVCSINFIIDLLVDF